MAIALSSLRVTAALDVSAYAAGMAQKVAADREGAASSSAVGAALKQTDARVSDSASIIGRLSRQHIDGFGSAQRFDKAIRDLGRSFETENPPIERAQQIVDGLYRKYGLAADASALLAKGQVALGEIVANTNVRFAKQADEIARTATAARQQAATQMIGLEAPSTGSYRRSQEIDRANMLLSTLGQRVKAAAGDVAGLAQAGGLAAHQFMNLGYQLNDVVTMLAMGASPFMIIASQGGQIYQILGSSPQGVGGALKEIGSRLLALINPARAVVGGIVAIGVAGVAAYESFQSGQRDVERALSGIGRASGATVDDINRIAEASADASGLSISAAREVASALAATGKISVENIGGIAGEVRDLAAALGTDIPQATELLATAFADPVRGADQLNQKLGFLDDRTREYVRRLAEQNDRSGAQRALLAALIPSIADAAERTSIWAQAWHAVSTAASDAIDAMGRAVSPAPDDERMRTIQERIARYEAAISRNAPYSARFQGELPALYSERDSIVQRRAAAAAASEQARLRQSGLTAGDLARSLTPGYETLRQLQEQQATLQGALSNPTLSADALGQVADRYNAITRAVQSYLTPAERKRQLDELEIQALNAKSPAEKAAIAARRAEIDQAGQVITSEEAVANARRAGAFAAAQASLQLSEAANERLRSAQEQVDSINFEIQMLGATAGEAERVRMNYQLLSAAKREAAQNNTTVSQAEISALKEIAAAAGEARQRYAELSLQRDLQFERDQMFRSPQDQAVASRLRSAGLPIDFDSAAASAIRFNEQLALSRDLVSDFAGGFVSEFMNGASAIDAATSALARLGDRLLQLALDQAINALFSNMMGMLGGSSGGTVGSMVGGSFVAAASDPWAGLRFADGGLVRGPGSDRSDNIIARLSPNEFVVNAAATRAHLPTLMAMNSGRIRGFADGGPVSIVDALRGFRGATSDSGGARGITVHVHMQSKVPGVGVTAGAARQRSEGVFDMDMIIHEIDGRLAENIANRRGALAPAMEGSYGLNPMKGRSR